MSCSQMEAVLSSWWYREKLNLMPRAFLHRGSVAKQSQGVNLKCNSYSERTSHVGSLILLWEGLCAVLLHPVPKALSVQQEECPHRERMAFPGYFTMLHSPRRCTWFYVPMNVSGASPSALPSASAFAGELCFGMDHWRSCVFWTLLGKLCITDFPEGMGLNSDPCGLGLPWVMLELQFGIAHHCFCLLPRILTACVRSCLCLHVVPLHIQNHQENQCMEYEHYLNIAEQEWKREKSPSVLQRGSVKSRLCD